MHQALHPFAVDHMAAARQVAHHLAAAVERVAGVFLVDEATQYQIITREGLRSLPRVHAGAGHPGQHALAAHGQRLVFVDPTVARHGRLMPDFFLRQSSSILRRPISLYSRSGALWAATGWGPRLP
jgi:hypothetical protein